MEEPFFFDSSGVRLFGTIHSPKETGRNNRTGIVFCEPFIEEKLWAHRLMVNFARRLAGESFRVLRFDCMGHGDSEGDFRDITVQSQIRDTCAAADLLAERAGVENVILLGLRLGGTVALLSALKNKRVKSTVLWNPVINCRKYFKDCLRSNLTTQMAVHGKVIYDRDEMIRDLENGKPVNLEGYTISPEYYREITGTDLLESARGFDRPSFVVQIGRQAKPEAAYTQLHGLLSAGAAAAEFETVCEEPFWQESLVHYQYAENLFNVTAGWLNRIGE